VVIEIRECEVQYSGMRRGPKVNGQWRKEAIVHRYNNHTFIATHTAGHSPDVLRLNEFWLVSSKLEVWVAKVDVVSPV